MICFTTLTSAVRLAAKSGIILPERANAIYQYAYRRISKKGVDSVQYEISPSIILVFTKHIENLTYTVEILINNQEPSENNSELGAKKVKPSVRVEIKGFMNFWLFSTCSTKQYGLWCDTS